MVYRGEHQTMFVEPPWVREHACPWAAALLAQVVEARAYIVKGPAISTVRSFIRRGPKSG